MDMGDYRIIILATIVFIVGWLSVISFHKSPDRRAFSFFVGSVSFWALTLAFFYFSKGAAFDFWGRMVYVSGGLIAFLFLRFAFLFSRVQFPPYLKILVALPWALLSYYYFFSPFLVQKVFFLESVRGYSYGPGHLLFDVYFFSYFIIGFFLLFRAFSRERDQSKRLQFVFIIIGTCTGLALSASTNIILPWFGRFELLWAGPIGVAIWAGILSYGIMRHHLLNIQIIATEIFVSFMWVVLFINIFIFNGIEELLFNISIFSIMLLLGILLIRSVVSAVEQKEELERLSKGLSQANEDLKRLDEAKSEFISIASHQLRTPLTSVKGYISILLEGTFGRLTAGQVEALHKIYVSSERLIKLIDDLLSLSRIESGRMRYDFQNINICALIKDVVEENMPNAEKKELRLVVTEPLFPISLVRADPDKIRQVFMNLIDNAIRYTDKGGLEARFYKSAESGKNFFGVVFEDTGRGISADDIEHLFAKFVRSERTRKLYTEGSGLGLYIARQIVDDHGGRIYVKSDGVGKGSSFFVELPVAG